MARTTRPTTSLCFKRVTPRRDGSTSAAKFLGVKNVERKAVRLENQGIDREDENKSEVKTKRAKPLKHTAARAAAELAGRKAAKKLIRKPKALKC